jgi:hypothetical protein
MTGTTQTRKHKPTLTRPIKSKRDLERVLTITQRMRAQPKRDTEAELRLQALLKEMDRFEDVADDADEDSSDVSSYGGPCRRWVDDGRDDR